jgi:transposase
MNMSYIGVDLHTNSLTACYRTKQGKERTRTFALSRIGDFVKTLRKQDKVAVEATGNTKFFVEQIGKRVKKVVVVDPNQFEVIRKSVRKTDKHDARTLALYLSKP